MPRVVPLPDPSLTHLKPSSLPAMKYILLVHVSKDSFEAPKDPALAAAGRFETAAQAVDFRPLCGS
jgi:hypothetical protein